MYENTWAHWLQYGSSSTHVSLTQIYHSVEWTPYYLYWKFVMDPVVF